MDKARQVLAQGVPPGVRRSYRTLADHGGVARSTLHHRAHGRPSMQDKAQSQQYLTPWEESALVKFILHMSDLGRPVRIKHIPSLAFVATRGRPVRDRPSKPPGKNWAKAFERRHPEMTARRVTALDWNRHENNIADKMTHWFEVIGEVLRDPAIVAENVYNMDETGVMLSMLGSVKVLVGKDDKRTHRGARVKRTMVTAIECISADGRYLNPMIIWPATTHRSNWTTFPTPRWHYTCNESGYTDSNISLQWLKRVFDPETKGRANGRPRVLILDGFGTHETLEILEYCFANNIILCRLPSHTSHKLQPCDVAVFGPLKTAYREQVERLERGGVNAIGKEHFTYLYKPARERAFTAKNIKAGFAASGLFPLNPDRVLRTVPKPPVEVAPAVTNEASYQEDGVLQTPITPVSADGLLLLQNLILKKDAHALDENSQQNLQRHLLKLAKATQLSLTKSALQQNHIQLLMAVNNEAKSRRSTRADILEKGSGQVFSYEHLQDKRLKRAEEAAAKEAKAKAKGKRGRKSKNAAQETAEATASTSTVRRGRKRKSTEVEGDAGPPVPKSKAARVSNVQGIAPVARMY
ncbi:uncharacterized protein yc1106_00278 [Curvularia clavata]|uniref:HTH CENPB-type domain-containing protein n=1 Tax=Curvularia clavata TaxID=95742 RepID=A0A9Q8YZQ3_CURCL|nr:uncharacterized protein yc1106_00278 [Curvularia clavata]